MLLRKRLFVAWTMSFLSFFSMIWIPLVGILMWAAFVKFAEKLGLPGWVGYLTFLMIWVLTMLATFRSGYFEWVNKNRVDKAYGEFLLSTIDEQPPSPDS
jgi:hypothetical protein